MIKSINHHREASLDSLVSTSQLPRKYVYEAIDMDTFDGPPSAAQGTIWERHSKGTSPSLPPQLIKPPSPLLSLPLCYAMTCVQLAHD